MTVIAGHAAIQDNGEWVKCTLAKAQSTQSFNDLLLVVGAALAAPANSSINLCVLCAFARD
jgi:hypothetical protein